MALSNLRRNPIDSSTSERAIVDEAHTVGELLELPGVYGFSLDDRPVADTISIVTDDTAATPFTIVLAAPSPGQVFVDFNTQRGLCIFNIADDATAVLCTYDGLGSNNTVENSRALASEEIAEQLNELGGIQETLVSGTNIKSINGSSVLGSGNLTVTASIDAQDLEDVIESLSAASALAGTEKLPIVQSGATVYATPVQINEFTKYAKLADVKSSGTTGGAGTATTWTKSTLIEVSDVDNIVSIASSVITLQAGTYRVNGSIPLFAVNNCKARLRNTTDGATTINGTSEYTDTSAQVRSFVNGKFTIASAKTFELQYWFAIQTSADDLGLPVSSGEDEIYSELDIWKIG